MTTFNTGNPIGSTDARDLSDNAKNMDYLENSTTELTHADRLGTVRKTRHGMEVEHDNQIAAHEAEHDAQMQSFENDFDGRLAGMAFTRVGSFMTGATLTDMRQVLIWEVSQGGDGHEYGWAGIFPKAVSAGSTPTPLGSGGWIDRTDVVLRGDINIVVKRFNSVADFVADVTLSEGMTIETTSYHNGLSIGGNTYFIVSGLAGLADGGSVINLDNGLKAIGLFRSGFVSPSQFGANPSTANDDSIAFSAALNYSKSIHVENGTWNISNVDTQRDSIITCEGRGVIFKKSTNGYILNLKARSILEGGPCFDGSYYDLGLTGNTLFFDDGTHTDDIAAQGHQLVTGCVFYNSDSYHIAYAPSMGWMSSILECSFNQKPANADANILWPEEPTTGGNRHVIGCYSVGPLVNTGSADNGLIDGNEIGSVSSGLDEQGVIFPAGKNPRKIRVVNNRFAISNGRLIIRGGENVFSNNITAGDVIFYAGAVDCVYDETNIQTGSFTDSSGAKNNITKTGATFYTPRIKAGVVLGDGNIQGEYKRSGHYIDFRFELTIGSTTVVNATMVFDLPVPVLAGTRVFLGQALASGYTGISSIAQASSDVRVYNTTSVATWNATVPKTWVSGDVIIIQGTYRIG